MSMLEERIKRSSKAPPAAKPAVEKGRRTSIRKPVQEEAPKPRYIMQPVSLHLLTAPQSVMVMAVMAIITNNNVVVQFAQCA